MRTTCIGLALLAVLGVIEATATTPLPDGRPEFFSGGWIGTGGEDSFCFMRLQTDGSGTVLVGNASGDWFGARIRWRNERQVLRLVGVDPLPADSRRRLMPLLQLTLTSGMNRTVQLNWSSRVSACELQPRGELSRREGEAAALLDAPQPGERRGSR